MENLKKIHKSDDNPAQKLYWLLSSEMQALDSLIDCRLDSSIPLIPTISKHIIHSGGKRLRPLLTIAFNRLLGSQDHKALFLAAAVEFIHTATLLHDDVVDNSQMRRGKNSANALWGNQPSILVGDFLFARAFELMVETNNMAALDTLSKASARIAEGEVFQLSKAYDLTISVEESLEIISAKTAELFGAACQVGAIIAHQPSEIVLACYHYGHDLGMAFQIIDDLLDYTAQSANLGKDIGDDFFEGKITLPVILSIKQGTEEIQRFWHNTFEKEARTSEDLTHAISILENSHAIEASRLRAIEYSTSALTSLNKLPASPLREELEHLTYYVINRLS